MTAIEGVYRGRGFAAAKVQADPSPQPATSDGADSGRGEHSHHRRRPDGGRRSDASKAMRRSRKQTFVRRLALQPGAPYFDAQLRRDTDALQLEYANRGYRSATVQAQPRLHAGSRAGESGLHRSRGSAGVRRSRSDRRQRSNERRDDRARASAQAWRSAQPRGGVTKASGGWRRFSCSAARRS